MRWGLLGGTFDPIHYGHLLLAECCREQCQLDQVWFVPAAVPPHKQGRALSDARHRVEMLRLATGGHDGFRVSGLEIERGGVSYTVDTLRQLQQQHAAAELFLLVGSDTLADLPTWREPAEIMRRAMPVVVRRGAATIHWAPLAPLVSAERLAQFARNVVEMPLIELSSTDIRARIAARRSIRYRTPRAVEMYIQSHALYRGPAS